MAIQNEFFCIFFCNSEFQSQHLLPTCAKPCSVTSSTRPIRQMKRIRTQISKKTKWNSNATSKVKSSLLATAMAARKPAFQTNSTKKRCPLYASKNEYLYRSCMTITRFGLNLNCHANTSKTKLHQSPVYKML